MLKIVTDLFILTYEANVAALLSWLNSNFVPRSHRRGENVTTVENLGTRLVKFVQYSATDWAGQICVEGFRDDDTILFIFHSNMLQVGCTIKIHASRSLKKKSSGIIVRPLASMKAAT